MAPTNNGILASAELYDPATGTWTFTGSLNIGRDGHTATLLTNGEVLVAGGEALKVHRVLPLRSAQVYNSDNGTWTPTGRLNTGRYVHTATLLSDGFVLVAGGRGFGIQRVYLASAELYDPGNGP